MTESQPQLVNKQQVMHYDCGLGMPKFCDPGDGQSKLQLFEDEATLALDIRIRRWVQPCIDATYATLWIDT